VIVNIIGSGAMGSGIAQTAALSGHSIVLHDTNQEALDRAMSTIDGSLARFVKKEKLTEEAKQAAIALIGTETALDSCAKADVVVEAVFENIDVKSQVWKSISEVASSDCLLASNTSSLSITEIASFVDKPERFCGMHFFNPVAMMPLVEVVKALQTSDETIAKAKAFVEGIGKSPIVCEDKPGFIVNRLLVPYINDAVHALSEGVASAEDIDAAMKMGANMPIGPLGYWA